MLAPTEAPMTTTVTTEYSTLQNPPHDFSRRQVLFLDGLRYSVEMAQIAYKRLYALLQSVSRISDENPFISSAEAMLYAWAIVDSTRPIAIEISFWHFQV